jgi:hypothetical protein
MKRDSKLNRISKRLWWNTHKRFKEMCVLAVTGQLDERQMSELDEHIATCDWCCRFLESVSRVSVQSMPLLAENRVPAADIVPPEGMRTRILLRAAAECSSSMGEASRFSGTLHAASLHFVECDKHQEKRAPNHNDEPSKITSGFFSPLWRSVAALAASAAIGIGGFYFGLLRSKRTPQQTTQTQSSVEPAFSQRGASTNDSDRITQLERQKLALARELAAVRHKLFITSTEEGTLSVELAATKKKLLALTAQTGSTSPRSSEEHPQTLSQIAALQGEADRLAQALSDSEFYRVIQEKKTADLNAKLEAAQVDLQRERDAQATKSELGDLAAARNLHIVDVYDADPNGKRRRSFGRVFYVEGKSLVFYAYDLDDPHRFKANVVFRVWGGKAGENEVTHSLGILQRESGGGDRWTMTFDDHNVLTRIDSVFVTAEPVNKHYDRPHGKEILYAYFGGEPNHP